MSDELLALNLALHEVEAGFITQRMALIRTFLAGKSEAEQLRLLGDEKTRFEGTFLPQALAHSPYASVHSVLMERGYATNDLYALVTLARQSPSRLVNEWAEAELAIMLPGVVTETLDTAING